MGSSEYDEYDEYDEYVVDGTGWSHAQEVTAVRLVLAAVRDRVGSYECDIPADPSEWPLDVLRAALVLRGIGSRTGRIERGGYATTGIVDGLDGGDDGVWPAFVTFAPYAWDATVWAASGEELVSLADAGSAVSVHLDRSGFDSLAPLLGEDRLVLWRDVKKARAKRFRLRPSRWFSR